MAVLRAVFSALDCLRPNVGPSPPAAKFTKSFPHRIISAIQAASTGDVSGDGTISSFDASLILSHVIGLTTLSGEALRVADVSDNGTVTAYDAALILQFSVGLIGGFPADEAQHIFSYR